MKDFKNPNLYKLEQGTFETFVDSMLETNTEYNQSGRLRSGLVEEEEEATDYFESVGGWSDEGGMDNFDFDFSSGLNSPTAGSSSTLYNPRGYTVEEMGALRMLLTAPIHAVRQTFDAVIDIKKLNPKTRVKIAKDWRVWGLVLGGFSTVGLLPFVTSFIYLPVGIGMLASAGLADYYYGQKGGESIIAKLVNGNEEDFENSEDGDQPNDTEDDLDTDLGNSGESDPFGGFGGFSGFDGFGEEADTFSDRYSDFEDEESDTSKEDDYYDPESMGALATDYFPESPIETDNTETFREGLIDVYKSGINAKGKMLYSRSEIVKYYAKYMPNNDKAFARWTSIREHSPEYDNIAYTIYKTLVAVNGKFDMRHAVPAGEKLTVMDMKRTPLIYKITIKLPSYFKINDVTRQANIFNDMLKASDDDEKVGTILTTYGGDLVVKFLRLDYKKLVSMGDLLRLNDDNASESFAEKFATNKGVPMVAGMRDNEYPYMVDIVGNPAASIVGGSGSGKSWLTFQFMDSMLIANNPEHLNFIILDAKDASIWKQFALAPHVLGYHSDYHDFIDILMEIKAEHERRMKMLSSMGIESWKDYSSRCQRNGDNEKLAEMPLLFVIIDEITYTMSSLQNEDIDQYKELKNILTQLSSVIRASGIRLMLIGQRAIDTSIPKGFLANSPLKLSMKMNVQSDFTTMLGKGYDREVSRIPSGPGEGIMLAEGQTKPSYVKTVIPGGKDDGDILMQVRVMALDWVRRTQGTQYDYTTLYNDMNTTIKKGFNRDTYYNQALIAVNEGRITDPLKADEGYLMAINSPNANLFNNAMENVERKLQEKPSSAKVNEPEDEEMPDQLDVFDWDSLLEEPEQVDDFYLEESELAEEPYTDTIEEENDTVDLDLELAEPVPQEFDFGSFDEMDYQEEELVPEEREEADYQEEELVLSEQDEYELEDYGVTEEPEYPEEPVPIEPEVGEIELEEVGQHGTANQEVNGTFSMSLEDMMDEEDGLHQGDNEPENEPTYAGNMDIKTMLDMANETFTDNQESETESEEYLNYKKEQEELENLRKAQQEMLDKLQKQQEDIRKEEARKVEEERKESARRAEELRLAEEARLAEERKAEELRLAEEQRIQAEQKELERKQRLAEEQKRIEEQRAELEKQKQEIVRLQRELDKAKESSEPVQVVTPEPKRVNTKVPEQAPSQKAPVQKEELPKVKQVPIKKVVKAKPAGESKPKPVKRKKVESKPKESQPNLVNYKEMDDMSVSQYIAHYGELDKGQRRVESGVIKAKFNRRKITVAVTIGEVYEDGDYFYYVG